MKTSDFGLKPSPFRTLPTDESVKHWAGMPEQKKLLEDVIKSVQPDDIGEQEFVIIHGSYGGGKTHALRYFARKIIEGGDGYAFFVRKIRLGAKPNFVELFRSIINENRDILPDLVEQVKDKVKKEENLAKSEQRYFDFKDTIPSANVDLVSHFLTVENDIEKIVELLVSVRDDYSAVTRFATLISVMTSKIGNQPAPYKAAYIFFDEAEDMLNLKYAELFQFFGACRELVNRTAENHCAIVFAFAVGAAELSAQIEPSLMERLSRDFIKMKQLTDVEAKNFVKDYLQSVRLEGEKPIQPFFPFSESTIDFLLERDSEIVPRHLIKDMGRVFERAVRRGKIESGEEISRETAEEIFNEMGV